ncbi:glycosyltransferase family 2 protein [Bacteroidales bacterium OttesenSCG-928-B11]|nr:glycosyltransferase family 2 protein [Bacteroidales bacterium OttesenSCG-928-C03]MDL2311376.1 glycosyltransferase family 2 protein [Bacteroidales bacterium OttesenSCG-928-B11]MDL2326010.1 glycosyltransferase family 2 protein [Bacteroidales bacterium OttesenSCG-928-A14]
MKLSVIIVNYNVKYFIEQCLISVYQALQNIESEVFVVDNNSTDGSLELLKTRFPQINLIENKENVGFSKANNQALAVAQGEYALLLNPDTLVEEDTFVKCLDFMDKTADAGALGVKMVNGKGEFLPESKRGLPLPNVAFYKIFGFSKLFPKSKKFSSYHLTHLSPDETNAVDVLSGAFMLMRKSLLDQIGYLDEDYFMYGEDIDLSYRITKAGYKNYYFPETEIIHYKGESTKKGSINYVFVFYRAMQIFAKKHFSVKNAKLFNWLIDFAIWFRAGLAILKRVAVKLFIPAIDFIIVLVGLLAIAFYWDYAILSSKSSGFPDLFYYIIIPSYIVAWLASIAFCGGYKKPIRLSDTNKGILLGTILILLVYALLPESVRFSRAMVVFGAMWTTIALNIIRYAYHKFNIKDMIVTGKSHRRIGIIGKGSELYRIENLLKSFDKRVDYYGFITTNDQEVETSKMIGKLSEIDTIIPTFNLKEVIFSSHDLSIKEIINYMTAWKERGIECRIAPPESQSIIGCNHISSAEALLEENRNLLFRDENLKKKRAFDLISAVLLLISSPITIWLMRRKAGFVTNIFRIITGKRSWIGVCVNYHNTLHDINGVLSPISPYNTLHISNDMRVKIELLYITDYSLSYDLKILLRCFRSLGNP